ncbi:hypothetical protein ACH5RR_033755 [Cinchona calisaya]|uniref:RNase H type-1 domain-containing protein n=1 Tax=Cinchona calisaya TaxID=153742 RepID=A0ABD2YCS0_9GENT
MDIFDIFQAFSMALEDSRIRLVGIRIEVMIPKLLQPEILTWTALPLVTYKLNAHGSFLGNPGNAGGGGVVYRNNSDVLFGIFAYYGICSSLEAEFRALISGLKWCH